jgi:hypothetical protein
MKDKEYPVMLPCKDCIVFPICNQKIPAMLELIYIKDNDEKEFKNYYMVRDKIIFFLLLQCSLLLSYLPNPISNHERVLEISKFFKMFEKWTKYEYIPTL